MPQFYSRFFTSCACQNGHSVLSKAAVRDLLSTGNSRGGLG